LDKKQTKSQILKFWTKNEIHNFGRYLDEKWPLIAKKIVKFFHIHWHYHSAFTVGLKERDA